MRGAIFTSEKFIFPCVVSKYNVLCWPMLHVFFDALACLCFPVSQRCVLGIRIRRCVSLFICCSRASTACVYVCRASAHAAETGPVFDAINVSSKSTTKIQHFHCGLRIFGQLFFIFFKVTIYVNTLTLNPCYDSLA
jgi:hypothetical protein